jgi:hypothetical protein
LTLFSLSRSDVAGEARGLPLLDDVSVGVGALLPLPFRWERVGVRALQDYV